MSMLRNHLLAAACVLALTGVAPVAKASGPMCQTYNVAAAKVWLEKKPPIQHTLVGAIIDWLTDLFHLSNGQEDNTCDHDERSKEFHFIDADLDFEKVGTFTVPDMIRVVEGKARNEDQVILEMGVHDCDGYTGVVSCIYRRKGPPIALLLNVEEWQRYKFKSCSVKNITPGTKVKGNALSLHVDKGGKNCPDRRTTVAFTLNACDTGNLLSPTTASLP
jgi:hypothetical protein